MDWTTIVVALLGSLGVSFGFLQFMIKRSDDKEEKSVQTQIDNAIRNARTDITKEIEDAVENGIVRCGVIGDKAIRDTQSELEKQIEANSKQIGELTVLTKDVLTNMDAINKVVTISAESQRNSNYDRLLLVGKKALKENAITLSGKTNLRQLYDSYKRLKGNDPYIETLWTECNKLPTIPDENVG